MSDSLGVAANGAGPAEDIVDITIIGAGPTGLFAAFYAGMRGARTRIIDSLEEPGGALTAIYPEKYIYDVGGFPKILAKDLVEQLVQQAHSRSTSAAHSTSKAPSRSNAWQPLESSAWTVTEAVVRGS